MTMNTSNSSTVLIAPFLLEKDKNNYEDWKVYIKNYLLARNLWDITEYGHIPKGNWRKKNAAALHAILSSCSQDIFREIKDKSAKDAWNHLAKIPEEREPKERSSREEEDKRRSLEMTKKIYNGNLEGVTELIHFGNVQTKFPPITGSLETALHVAIKAEKDKIVEELIEMMSIPELEQKDFNGHTALSLAAFEGKIEWAKLLVQKNQGLLTIADNVGNIPLVRAANCGRKEMTQYLYIETLMYTESSLHDNILQPGKQGDHGFHLMRCCISNNMFDICWHLLKRYPSLAVCRDTQGVSPILLLSSQPHAFYSGTKLSCWQRLIYSFLKVELPTTSTTLTGDVQLYVYDQNHDEGNIRKQVYVLDGFRRLGLKVHEFPGIKNIHDLKLGHHLAKEVLLSMCKHVSTLEMNHQRDDFRVDAALFEATKHGIVEFVTELWKANPSFGFKTNLDDRLAFMVAVQHRRENVFNLIYGVNQAWNAGNTNKKDIDGNNMLHIAGGLAPDFERVGISSNPALRVQRELQWFKAVSNIVPKWCTQAKNNNDQTPKDVFTKSHNELVKEGQKWMTDTAGSFIILSILLVTVTFAVSFTVPGGNNETGLPILLGKKLFKIFIITDAISFFSASTSGLMFLGILTSRKDEEDFYVSLPLMLMIGLITLFVSIATMMASFCAALLIMLQVQLGEVILIIVASIIPTVVFALLQFPLICEIIVSTRSQGIFNRKMKPWLVNLQES
ncbi:hypothetical protein SLEP1_g37743 [Rubroshorea leprosula]|uniref:PGG domain-containing protein n=1 Tax=Rubroshorea leprosula TaxID=152421 RepID=A0AAV5KVT1_9ROSI|nr:hypothetical protein SLEP1_g37743 [Rubroshorea leprosula]